MKKKILSLILLAAMLLSMAAPVMAEETPVNQEVGAIHELPATELAIPAPEEPAPETVYPAEEPLAEIQSGTCGDNLTWSLNTETGTLTISGSGDMEDYATSRKVPWDEQRPNIASIVLPSGLTSIAAYAFRETSITSIIIPTSVTSIGAGAFEYCDSLIDIEIPNSITRIKNNVFYACDSLASVTIPGSVTVIEPGAFQYCRTLTNITISSNVTSIFSGAFSSCTSLTSITVDTNNAYYTSEDGVLYNKDKTTIKCYPAGKTAGSFTIPNSVSRVEQGTFADCSSLTSVTIPNSVTTIEHLAFFNCDNLTDVYYSGTAEQWNAIVIGGGNESLLNACGYFDYSENIAENSVISLPSSDSTLTLEDITVGAGTVIDVNGGTMNISEDTTIIDLTVKSSTDGGTIVFDDSISDTDVKSIVSAIAGNCMNLPKADRCLPIQTADDHVYTVCKLHAAGGMWCPSVVANTVTEGTYKFRMMPRFASQRAYDILKNAASTDVITIGFTVSETKYVYDGSGKYVDSEDVPIVNTNTGDAGTSVNCNFRFDDVKNFFAATKDSRVLYINIAGIEEHYVVTVSPYIMINGSIVYQAASEPEISVLDRRVASEPDIEVELGIEPLGSDEMPPD